MMFDNFLVFCAVIFCFKFVSSDPFAEFECSIPSNTAILPIADGDVWFNARSEYVANSPGSGACGTDGIILQPTTWVNPSIFLADPPAYRSNLMLFDALELWVNCPVQSAWNLLSAQFTHWVPANLEHTAASQVIMLAKYVDSNFSHGNWSRVRVPLMDMATVNWSLSGAEVIRFNTDSKNRQCIVDNICLLQLTPPVVAVPNAIADSDTIVWFNITKQFDLASTRILSNYAINSTTDPSYAHGLHPVDAAPFMRFQGFAGTGTAVANGMGQAYSAFTIYLKFPTPFKHGHTYFLHIGSLLTDAGFNALAPTVLNFTYSEYREVSSVSVNQEGYLPNAVKVAYVNGYYSDMGSLTVAVGAHGVILSRDKWTQIWSPMPTPSGFHHTLRGVAIFNEECAIAVGDKGSILRWNGLRWLQISISWLHADLWDVVISTSGLGVIVGDGGTILSSLFGQWDAGDGTVWTMFSPMPTKSQYSSLSTARFRSVYVPYDDSLMIVGVNGVALQYSISFGWFDRSMPSNNFSAVCGTPQSGQENNVISVGLKNTALFNRYGTLTPLSDWLGSIPAGNWSNCWMSSGSYGVVILVGENGHVVYLNGGASKITTNTEENILGIACRDPTLCIAVGENGTIVSGGRDAGKVWKAELSGTTHALHDIAVIRPGSLRLSTKQRQQGAVIVRASDPEVVLGRFNVTLRRSNDNLAGGDVWIVNFTTFNNLATDYHILIPGFGWSPEFAIGSDVLNLAAYHSCRALFYQRSGSTQIQPPFADPRWARGFDHGPGIDAAYHWAVAASPLYVNETICSLEAAAAGACPVESMRETSGGWFDAGDYGKYCLTAAMTVWALIDGYTMNPEKYGDDWNIPESKNGVPDVLDEAQWELTWLEKMQAEDGGVYEKIAADMWEDQLPADSNNAGYSVRFVLPRCTATSATYGAAMARAAHVWADIDSAASQRYLSRAEAAFKFLLAWPTNTPVGGFENPPNHVSGPYGDSDDRDNRCFLYAELFRTTCNDTYAVYFENLFATGACGFGWNDYCMYGKKAQWAYIRATCPHRTQIASVVAEITSNFYADALNMLSYADANSFRASARFDVYYWLNYGNFNQIGGVKDFMMAQVLFPELAYKFLDHMIAQVDIALGANPLSKSFITGVGDNQVLHPLHWSRWLPEPHDPTPGINVFGAATHNSFANAFDMMSQIDQYNYPSLEQEDDMFPVFRRYADAFYNVQYSEFGIGSLAGQCKVLMYLKNSSFADYSSVKSTSPTATPTTTTFHPTVTPSLKPTAFLPTTQQPTVQSTKPQMPTVNPTTPTSINSPTRRPSSKHNQTPSKHHHQQRHPKKHQHHHKDHHKEHQHHPHSKHHKEHQ